MKMRHVLEGNRLSARRCLLRTVALLCLWLAGSSVAAERVVKPVAADVAQRVVRMGAFAGTINSGVWMEALKRDVILRKALARLGMGLEFQYFSTGRDMSAAFVAGEIDMGPLTEVVVFKTAVEADLSVIGMIAFAHASVIAHSADSPRELTGARIGTLPDTIGAVAVERMLEADGMRIDQVRRVDTPPARMLEAMERREVDAVAVWEPTPQRLLRAHPEYRLLYRTASPTVLASKNAFLNQHPEAAREVVAAFLRAYRWIGAHDTHLLRAVQWALDAGKPTGNAGVVPASAPNAQQNAQPDADSLHAVHEGARSLRASATGVLGLPLLPVGWTTVQGEGRQVFEFMQRRGTAPGNVTWHEMRPRLSRVLMQSVLRDSGKYRVGEFRYEP